MATSCASPLANPKPSRLPLSVAESTDAPRVAAWTSVGNTRSWGLMERLGMARTPALDFHHPKYAEDDPDGAMIVYTIARPA